MRLFTVLNVKDVVDFFLPNVIFIFLIVSTSLAYINIPKSKSKPKITWDKKKNNYNIYTGRI